MVGLYQIINTPKIRKVAYSPTKRIGSMKACGLTDVFGFFVELLFMSALRPGLHKACGQERCRETYALYLGFRVWGFSLV